MQEIPESSVQDFAVKISASQITTFMDCPRKWAYDKLDKVPRPDNKSTVLGGKVHAEIEDYFNHGTAPTSKAAQALLEHLPENPLITHARPLQSIIVEAPFNFTWPGTQALLTGFMDLVDRNTHTIYDHKTTSNIKRYAKTADDLRVDPQAIIYGTAYRVLWHQVPEVNLQWTYVETNEPKTKPPNSQPTKLKQDLTDLENGIKLLSSPVEEIYQIRSTKGARAADVRVRTEGCLKFGGCPYRHLCPDYRSDTPKTEEKPVNLSLLKTLAAASAKPMTATELPDEPEAVVAPVAAPTPPTEGPTDVAFAKDSFEPTPSALPEAGFRPMPLLDSLAIQFGTPAEVIPPDAQTNVTPTEPPPPPVKEAAEPKRKPKAKTKAKDTPVETTVTLGDKTIPTINVFEDDGLDNRPEDTIQGPPGFRNDLIDGTVLMVIAQINTRIDEFAPAELTKALKQLRKLRGAK